MSLYEIVDVLKDDKNGKVQLAYDKAGKQICIIKQRQLSSINLYYKLKEIKNKYVPEIYRLMKFDGTLFVVEEYIDGRTLADILKYDTDISENLATDILRQICECLKNLHAENIIHRDIKPSNIMLTKNGNIKFIDFGISRISKIDGDSDTEKLGTRGYAPPEQYGFGQTDARSDIYALGITIKRLIGKNYHGYLNEIISRCTAIDPADRYESVSALMADIDKSHWHWRFKRLTKGLITIALITLIVLLIPKDIFNDDSKEIMEEAASTQTVPIKDNKSIESKPLEKFKSKNEIPKQTEWSEIKWNDIEINPPSKSTDIMESINDISDVNQNRQDSLKKLSAKILLNGQQFNYDMQDISQNVWLTWRREKDIIYLPDNWTISLQIDNQNNLDLNNLKILAEFGRDEQYIPVPNIKSNQSATINIPIPSRKFSNTNFNLKITLIDDNEDIKFHDEINFYLIDYPKWRADQLYQNKVKK